jgi:outer membrane protein assembly factor BamD
MSYEYKQKDRFEKVLSECNDFVERFTDSKHLEEVNKYKILTTNNLKNLKHEQIAKTNER